MVGSETQLIKQRSRALRMEFMRPMNRLAELESSNDAALLAALSLPRNARQPEAMVVAGVPDDFVLQLRNAANEILHILDQRAQDMARWSAEAASVQGEVVRGKGFVGLLDSMVTLRFEGDPSAAAEWRSLMRKGRLRRPFVEDGASGGGKGSEGGGVGAGHVGRKGRSAPGRGCFAPFFGSGSFG